MEVLTNSENSQSSIGKLYKNDDKIISNDKKQRSYLTLKTEKKSVRTSLNVNTSNSTLRKKDRSPKSSKKIIKHPF